MRQNFERIITQTDRLGKPYDYEVFAQSFSNANYKPFYDFFAGDIDRQGQVDYFDAFMQALSNAQYLRNIYFFAHPWEDLDTIWEGNEGKGGRGSSMIAKPSGDYQIPFYKSIYQK
jgi:hypothetical protein